MVVDALKPLVLLVISNLFMTYAWYGHLKDLRAKPLYLAIIIGMNIKLQLMEKFMEELGQLMIQALEVIIMLN